MSTVESNKVLNNMDWRVKLVNWVKTTRVQTALVTALSLWVGFVTVKPLGIQSAVLLGVVGLLVHLWGFTLNEVEDYEYDAKSEDAGGHPIAQGKVHAELARYFAWGTALVAVAISALTPYPIEATGVLLLSFIPGYMYDKFSKQHWWSNIYLSVWAALMVLAGALYAGTPNTYTTLLAVAVGIQIFVQVIQGDLKDLHGDENTLAGALGVSTKVVEGRKFDPGREKMPASIRGGSMCKVTSYSRRFTSLVYGLKGLEGLILGYLAVVLIQSPARFPYSADMAVTPYLTIFMLVGIAFITSVSMFMVYCYDRDEIKKKSSIHELTSIVLLGITVAPLDIYGAILIGLGPIVWYATVNHLIHSDALNPDI